MSRTRRFTTGLVAGLTMTMLVLCASVSAQDGLDAAAWFKAYDAAFNARDIDALGRMYHPEVTIFEGAGINRGWADYRDNHLGPELRSFQNLEYATSNLQVHPLGPSAAYVTADYTIKYAMGDRKVDGAGIATHVLVKEDGRWMIRHSQTASRRRPPAAN